MVKQESSEESMLSEEFVEQDEELPLPAKSVVYSFCCRTPEADRLIRRYLHSGMMDLVGVHLTEMVVVSV